MLLAERRDCEDYCSIFTCEDWQLLKVILHVFIKSFKLEMIFIDYYFYIKHFKVDTDNLEGLSWSPNCVNFALWESPVEVKKILKIKSSHFLTILLTILIFKRIIYWCTIWPVSASTSFSHAFHR
jgi:hypothetical protein